MQDYKQSPQSSQSSQSLPPPPPLPSGWIAQWDETHNRYFYANTVTGQTQWELPTEPATPGGGEANAYQGAPPQYSQVDPKQSPSSSSDRGLGSFMSSAMGGGRPQNGYGNQYQNGYGNQYQSGYGGGYPNNGGYSNSGNSGFPGGGSMGGMIAGSLMGLVAGRVLGNDHRHQRPGLIGSFMAPALPNGGFMGPQYGNPYGHSNYQNYGRHGHHQHHGHHHHHHNHHNRW